MREIDPGMPVGLGIIGLGLAGAGMARAALVHPGIVLQGAVVRDTALRLAFARDFSATPHASAEELCADPAIDMIYIASPHQFHAEHALLAAAHGKHIILEKPMALNLGDCDRIIDAVRRAGVHLIVGPTHGFDPAIGAMRTVIESGELGRLGMIATWNYTSFLYRPRRPEELNTAQGGGSVFNQAPHQIDTVCLLGGGMARSLRAAVTALDPTRPTEGGYTAFLEFESGVAATMTYSGYDFFDSDEFHFWVAEGGGIKTPGQQGAARRALKTLAKSETELRTDQGYRGTNNRPAPPHQPHGGITIVTCERGEMRASADGLLVYTADGVEERPLPRNSKPPGQGAALDEMLGAIRTGKRPTHNERWGKASVEAMFAIFQSARERREITLQYQVPVN